MADNVRKIDVHSGLKIILKKHILFEIEIEMFKALSNDSTSLSCWKWSFTKCLGFNLGLNYKRSSKWNTCLADSKYEKDRCTQWVENNSKEAYFVWNQYGGKGGLISEIIFIFFKIIFNQLFDPDLTSVIWRFFQSNRVFADEWWLFNFDFEIWKNIYKRFI